MHDTRFQPGSLEKRIGDLTSIQVNQWRSHVSLYSFSGEPSAVYPDLETKLETDVRFRPRENSGT